MKTRMARRLHRQQLLTGCHHGGCITRSTMIGRLAIRRGASITVGFVGFVTLSLAGTESLMEEAVHSTGVTMEQKAQFARLAGNYIRAELEEDRKKGGVEEWEKEKSGCSFCQHFLQSPCKSQFTWWSKCVDKSKDAGLDYVGTCGEYTDALMACTSEHASYFEAEAAKAEKERGKDKEK